MKYEQFKDKIESRKFAQNYEQASRGDEVMCFQDAGLDNETVRNWWVKYGFENNTLYHCEVRNSCLYCK